MIGIPEAEEREQEINILFEEIMIKNFPNLVKEKDTQVQKDQTIPKKMDPKKTAPKHIIKMAKIQGEVNLKSCKRKGVSYLQGSSYKTVR